MSAYDEISRLLPTQPKRWLVTGAAGFIGSHLVETLLILNQEVVGLDNLFSGKQKNLDQVQILVGPEKWRRFKFLQGDIRSADNCRGAVNGIDYVLHQAAIGSVPRSIAHPMETHDANVNGFLNMLMAARDAKVRRFVYASSSSVYGDEPDLPKREEKIGNSLSPYAVSKHVNELYAKVFGLCYGIETIGLRYFNVFGERQDPNGHYAAVIPKWIVALMKGEPVQINGDGETSRDFCYVANVVQANLLAATCANPEATNKVYNIALNGRATLNELYEMLRERAAKNRPEVTQAKPIYQDFRPGDVRHSQADISLAEKLLGYSPQFSISQGLDQALGWYQKNL